MPKNKQQQKKIKICCWLVNKIMNIYCYSSWDATKIKQQIKSHTTHRMHAGILDNENYTNSQKKKILEREKIYNCASVRAAWTQSRWKLIT